MLARDEYGNPLHPSLKCATCGKAPLWESERFGGGTTCFRCRFGGPSRDLLSYPAMNLFGDGSFPMDYDAYEGDDVTCPPSQQFKDGVNAVLCRGFCVECKAPMNKAERLASLACPKCVETLGTDEATGRWDGKPDQQEKKEVA